jgi:large subunit ribosomal protein L15
MVVQKAKKVTKYRAHTTHGGGHRKKRRGAGSRGGRGNAGSGKRAGQKKAGLSTKLGKTGFTSKTIGSKAVALRFFTLKTLNKLVEKQLVTMDKEIYVVNLAKLGYQKLLSTGNIAIKLRITVDQFTPRAEEKVKAAGGEIVSSVPIKKNAEE